MVDLCDEYLSPVWTEVDFDSIEFKRMDTGSKVATIEDINRPEISAAIAKKLAKIHSLDLPICKLPDYIEMLSEKFKVKSKTINLDKFSEQECKIIENLIAFKIDDELKWLSAVASKIGHRVVLCHNDLSLDNFLIKTEDERDQL
ncbi:Choline kinase alpha-like protein [Dinothrombium tinctorium]|uniref:Choline kinase alpha-like protein n=1 Tax=Dinothrombium tinctorium TaxID=1965070 RepID=A0A3S3NR66_9ACAR|nr:Choline kinase alpha-like protein [Dinothrombium tinctorium]